MQEYIKVMNGLDAARRVGWARYYEKLEELEEVRRALERLAEMVIFHNRIHSQDEIIKIAKESLRLVS